MAGDKNQSTDIIFDKEKFEHINNDSKILVARKLGQNSKCI